MIRLNSDATISMPHRPESFVITGDALRRSDPTLLTWKDTQMVLHTREGDVIYRLEQLWLGDEYVARLVDAPPAARPAEITPDEVPSHEGEARSVKQRRDELIGTIAMLLNRHDDALDRIAHLEHALRDVRAAAAERLYRGQRYKIDRIVAAALGEPPPAPPAHISGY